MTQGGSGQSPVRRVPWTLWVAIAVACAVLQIHGRGYVGLPVLAIIAFTSALIRFRIPSSPIVLWTLRIALFALVITTCGTPNSSRGVGQNMLWYMNPEYSSLFGYLCAAELVVECWQRRKAGPPLAEIVILSALIFAAGTNVTDSQWIPWLAPAYVLFLALTLRQWRARASNIGAPAGLRLRLYGIGLRWSAILVALVLGVVATAAMHYYDTQMNQAFINWVVSQRAARMSGMSGNQQLTARTNYTPSPARVLRLENISEDVHLRGIVCDTYATGGTWLPGMDGRTFQAVAPAELRPFAEGRRVHATRLLDDLNLLYVPLQAAGIVPMAGSTTEWDTAIGHPLRSVSSDDSQYAYDFVLPRKDDYQGPLCPTLTADQRGRCLQLPGDLDPRIRQIAQEIVASLGPKPAQVPPVPSPADERATGGLPARAVRSGEARPDNPAMAPMPADNTVSGASLAHRELTMAMAVVRYLKDNHHYSLEVKPGPGDPVADFLANKRDAHCQFFASASVLLLRCMGIPTRYVGGYYCHENDGTNKMVVRLRDAHAWTEIWLDGVGWMTLDATPGSGRPDQANPPISPWRKLWEWIQDTAKAVASWIGSLRWPHFVFTFGMIPCVAACVSIVRRLRQRGPKLKATRYAYPNDDLEQIATAFEKLLRRRRIACPPNRTWQEHVAGLTHAESKAVDPDGLRAFLKQYNAVRFGDGRDARRLAELRETMERL